MKFNFIKPTLYFSLLGICIPGLTTIALMGLQMLISSIGIECAAAWVVVWILTTILGLLSPVLFYRYITTLTTEKIRSLNTRLTLFNLFQYIFIQSSLAPLFTKGATLCYVTDGQNGLELIFTGFLALPVLLLLSLFFNRQQRMLQMD